MMSITKPVPAAGVVHRPTIRRPPAAGVTRRLLFQRAAAGGALLAAACGGKASPEQVGARPAKLPPASLQLWTIWGGTRVPLMDEQSRRFTERNPGVTVEHVVLNGNERLDKILTAMAGGSPPDVPMIGRQEIPLLVEKVAGLVPIDAYMTRDRVSKSLFYEAEIGMCAYNGKTWALPMPTAGTYGNVYYNRDWLTQQGLDPDKSPPRSWDQLEELARKLTVRDGTKIAKLGFPMDTLWTTFWHWQSLNGGTFWSSDGRKITLEKAEDTLQWMVDFRNKINGGLSALQGFPPGGGNPFYTGVQAQTVSGVWYWYQIKTEAPDLHAGVYLRPARKGDEPKYLSLEAWAYGLSKGGRYPEQAWALVQFLTTDKDGAGWFMQQQGRPAPVKEFNQAPEMRQISPYWDVLLKALEHSVAPATFLPVHNEVVKAFSDQLAKLNQEQSTVQETVASMRADAQRIVDEFWASKGR